MSAAFALSAAAVFWTFFSIWKRDNFLNLSIKFLLLGLALWGSLLSAVALGFVVPT